MRIHWHADVHCNRKTTLDIAFLSKKEKQMFYHNSAHARVCVCVSKVSGISSKQLVQCEMSIKICLSTTLHHSVHILDDLQRYN